LFSVSVVPSKRIKDITGERFGRLVVQTFSHVGTDFGAYWNCICDCGALIVSSSHKLRKGRISCGCHRHDTPIAKRSKAHHKGKDLYFVRCGLAVKIGRTSNIHQRMSDFRTMNPYPVDLVLWVGEAGDKEEQVQDYFAKDNSVVSGT
jgi:hypothetical protein